MMMRLRPALYGMLPLLGLIGAALLLSLLNASDAYAQASGSANRFFMCFAGHPVGSLYTVNASCPTTLDFDHLFSFLVCNMEELTSNLMGNMFCGMITALTPAVSAVLVLSTIFFGIGFTIGVIPATAREFQMFLIKVACVWCFATQADYLIGLGYRLLVDGMRDGVDLVLLHFGTSSTTITVYDKLDLFVAKIIEFAARYIGVDTTKQNANPCQDALFAVMAVMAVAFPPFAFLAITFLIRIAITFLRAIFGYIYAMVGIAFLLCLAPFFLSFFLFKQTRSYFDKWLGYLVSFALQIVILFAFLAFILSVDTATITSSFSDIVMEQQVAKEGGSFRAPWEYCTLCDFEAYNPATGAAIDENQYAEFLGTGKLRCKGTTKTAIEIDAAISPNKDKLNTLIKFTSTGMIALLVLAYILEGLLSQVAYLAQVMAGGMSGGLYAPQLGGGVNAMGRQIIRAPGERLLEDFDSGFSKGFAARSNSLGGIAEGTAAGFRTMITGKNYVSDPSGTGLKRDKYGNPVSEDIKGAGALNSFANWLADPANMGESDD